MLTEDTSLIRTPSFPKNRLFLACNYSEMDLSHLGSDEISCRYLRSGLAP